MAVNHHNPFEVAQAQFDKAAAILDLDPATRDLLRCPMREFSFTIPVRLDDGTVRIFRGFRVQHNEPAAQARAASVSIRRRRSIRYAPYPCG